jgi:hypothetical protein
MAEAAQLAQRIALEILPSDAGAPDEGYIGRGGRRYLTASACCACAVSRMHARASCSAAGTASH